VLVDRNDEVATLDRLLDAARGGSSGVLVLLGEAGIGKTTLLDWTTRRAREAGMQVSRVAGFEAGMALGFAGLHQLLTPFMGGLDSLPAPQRRALEIVFGLTGGEVPDRFLVGLAALTLLTDAAALHPVLLVVDDAQWLDRASVDLLGFVARRLQADTVAILFALRDGEEVPASLEGLPALELLGLPDDAAAELLESTLARPLEPRLRHRALTDGAGNPLALVELANDLSDPRSEAASPAGPLRPAGRLSERYRSRIRALGAEAQTILLLASLSEVRDPERIWLAAERLGVERRPESELALDRFLDWGPPVVFRHPLLRSAAYHAASAAAQRRAHEVLAAVSDPVLEADRRAWHLAGAVVGPDEEVALALLRSAEQASKYGGLAAGASFLERAAELTPSTASRAERQLRAAESRLLSGELAAARSLLDRATPQLADPFTQARARRLDGLSLQAAGRLPEATAVLVDAAKMLEGHDRDLALDTLLEAFGAAWICGQTDLPLGVVPRLLGDPALFGPDAGLAELFLGGLAALAERRVNAGVALLRRAMAPLISDGPFNEAFIGRFRSVAMAGASLYDDGLQQAIEHRVIDELRRRGALFDLVPALVTLAYSQLRKGRLTAVESTLAETKALVEATAIRTDLHLAAELQLSAHRARDEEEVRAVAERLRRDFAERGSALGVGLVDYSVIVLDLGLGNYEAAFGRMQSRPIRDRDILVVTPVPPWDIVEVATRVGELEAAKTSTAELVTSAFAQAGSEPSQGLLARCRALIADDEHAEEEYRCSIEHLAHGEYVSQLARSHLVYGEWLRRRRRRRDARIELRQAYELFERLGMEAFARRAAGELKATGERARPRREVESVDYLTPQESQIAQLAADGHTNREIAGKLFISAATVDYHLRKVFRKLSVTSRSQLARALVTSTATRGDKEYAHRADRLDLGG
jgi:DNA-binding CsgD family transcriptional regulator